MIAGHQFEPLSILAFRAMSEHIGRSWDSGKLVEELEIKIELNWMLVEHLDNWVRFARQPPGSDQYKFPFELLGDSIRLQKLHLSFWFPNLRKLDLSIVNVSGKDIQHMLSNCCNLEWLSIVRCHLNGELKVNDYLPILENCLLQIHKYSIQCREPSTFEYRRCLLTSIPCLMSYPFKFSRMTYLQLTLDYVKEFDSLSLVSFLRSAPLIEKLELHFCNVAYERVVEEPEPMRKLSERLFNDMKSLHITGFEACKGKLSSFCTW
ncbi:hypothetical protein ZWY2020_028359 [Hordeum vulgare]|nr:hypothetical protein ZWY2020_028359 [Hordeum vulgare]